jgi:transcriptional regulator of acetoin/glycerol metabolism
MPAPPSALPSALPTLPPAAAGNTLRTDEAHRLTIAQSHARSAALGVRPGAAPEHTPLPAADLAIARERNRRLFDHAAPVMEMLYEHVVHSQSMVVLTDAAGVVIHSIGDDSFLQRAARVALQPGALWSEAAKGTNAIGTALVEEAPVLVHAHEHYVRANHFLTCTAAPILDARGQVLGVLDCSGEHRSYHPHTMALVKMSARMVENAWLADNPRHVLRLHLHPRAELIGSLMEGIVAVAADGRIAGANRAALELLHLAGPALRRHTLGSLFGITLGQLADHFRSPLATPLHLHTGLPAAEAPAPLYAVARFNARGWAQGLAEPVEPAAASLPPATPTPVQSLDALTSAAVREALAQAGGNVTQAARLLGISRSTLYRKLRDTPGA